MPKALQSGMKSTGLSSTPGSWTHFLLLFKSYYVGPDGEEPFSRWSPSAGQVTAPQVRPPCPSQAAHGLRRGEWAGRTGARDRDSNSLISTHFLCTSHCAKPSCGFPQLILTTTLWGGYDCYRPWRLGLGEAEEVTCLRSPS